MGTYSLSNEMVRDEMKDASLYYQLVVRIFKGRRFPQHIEEGGRFIAFEGRFNGETLTTDPKPLSQSPVFNTELVWEFGERKHRDLKQADNSTLKLRCVLAGDVGTTGAKLIGFVLLDLRTAACAVQSKKTVCSGNHCVQEGSWLPLRGSRQPLPEVKIYYKIDCKMLGDSQSFDPAEEIRFPTELEALDMLVTRDTNKSTTHADDRELETKLTVECDKRENESTMPHREWAVNSGLFRHLTLSQGVECRNYILSLSFDSLKLNSDPETRFCTAKSALIVGFAGRFELVNIPVSPDDAHELCTLRFDEQSLVQCISSPPSLLEGFMREHSIHLWLLEGNSVIASGFCKVNTASQQAFTGGQLQIKLYSTKLQSDVNAIEMAAVDFRWKLEETSMASQHPTDVRRKCHVYMTMLSLNVVGDPTGTPAEEAKFQVHCSHQGNNLLSSDRFSLTHASENAMAQSFVIDAPSEAFDPSEYSFSLDILKKSSPSKRIHGTFDNPNGSSKRCDECIGHLLRHAVIFQDVSNTYRLELIIMFNYNFERATWADKKRSILQALEYHDDSRGIRKFSLVIDLKEVRNLSNAQQTVYIRYSLPNVGFKPPILTNPPIDIVRHSKAVLKNGFSKFDFELDIEGVAESLSDSVKIELWSRNSFANDKLLALGDLNLWFLFRPDDVSQWHGRSEWIGEVRLLQVNEQSAKEVLSKGIGAVQVKCSGTVAFVVTVKLEFFDLGPLEHTSGFEPSDAPLALPHDTFLHADTGERAEFAQGHISTSETVDTQTALEDKSRKPWSRQGEEAREELMEHHSVSLEAQASATRHENGRADAENNDSKRSRSTETNTRVCIVDEAKERLINPLELEAFKREKIAILESEFRKHESLRQNAIKKKLEELAGLERTLKKGLIELEARERRLALAEEEAEMRQRSANSLLEQRRTELQEARRRMREEVAHDMNMAEAKRKDLSEQLQSLQVRLKESEDRNTRLDVELQKLKNAQRNTSEAQLMIEVASLKAKNEELSDKLIQAEQRHVACKEQLAKSLKVLSRKRDEEHEKELESMKLLLHAREESQEIRAERQTLDDLRRQIEALKSDSDAFPVGSWKPRELSSTCHAPISDGSALDFRSKPIAIGSIPEEEEESALDAGAAAQRDDFRDATRGDKGHELSPRGQGNDQTARATALSEDLSRLMDERDALLRTGMYTDEDEVIQEIGRHIQQIQEELEDL